MTARGHHPGRQYMVDAPTEVPLEGVAEEIPVGVLNDIRVELAKDVDESPGDGLFVSVPGVEVEIGIVHALFRVVDIDGLGGDVEVANPDRRLIRMQGAFKIGAQAPKPDELRSVFFRKHIECAQGLRRRVRSSRKFSGIHNVPRWCLSGCEPRWYDDCNKFLVGNYR